MISFSHVSKSFARQDVLVDCSFQVNPGERLGIIGANGSGKTTLFRLILGLEHPDQGQVTVPRYVRLGYLPQDVLQFQGKTVLAQVMDVAGEVKSIEKELSRLADKLAEPLAESEAAELAGRQSRLLEEFHRLGGYDLEARARKVLAGLGFSEADMERPVEELSGGWAMRVALARILLAEPDLILLDEPTNHLDIPARRVLEEALRAYEGTLCLVSHDRHLINAVANKVLVLSRGKAEIFPGNYDDYQRVWRKRLEGSTPPDGEPQPAEKAPASGSRKKKEQRRLEAARRNELHRRKAPLAEELQGLEEEIESLAGRLEELSRILSRPETYNQGGTVEDFSREYSELKASLEERNRQWEKIALELEHVEERFWEEKTGDSQVG